MGYFYYSMFYVLHKKLGRADWDAQGSALAFLAIYIWMIMLTVICLIGIIAPNPLCEPFRELSKFVGLVSATIVYLIAHKLYDSDKEYLSKIEGEISAMSKKEKRKIKVKSYIILFVVPILSYYIKGIYS